MSSINVEPLSAICSERIRWLWEPYLPRGKLAILDGDPGVGKSLLTVDIAARLSRGGPMPNGATLDRPHVSLLLSGEDKVRDTIAPRAAAAGADLARIYVLASTDGAHMSFPADLGTLEEEIRERRADLVVIDPIMAFLPPEVAANNDQCVRGVLNLFAVLAARTDCTILLVRHLRKAGAGKALHRGLGSIGIIGAVRAGLMAGPHPTDPDLRVVAPTKSNLAQSPPALEFRIGSDAHRRAVMQWTGELKIGADYLDLPGSAPLQPRDVAVNWLIDQLARGPRQAVELYQAAAEARIPERTLRRAKIDVKVKAQLVVLPDDRRVWYWYDPAAPWPKDAPFKRHDDGPMFDFGIG
jgi:hypothetical protein